MTSSFYVERILFVVAEPDWGKSKQIRSMYADVRFGTDREIPRRGRMPPVRLSEERGLYVRATSPHEMHETPEEFIDEMFRHFGAHADVRRWNVTAPLQPDKANNMPDVVDTCRYVKQKLNPERIRAVFLSPSRRGTSLDAAMLMGWTDGLRVVGVETCSIDARDMRANGLLLADFFNFI
jgi:hypothetical protein